jgi:hypothetical protein
MRLMGTRLRLFLTLILRYAAANNTLPGGQVLGTGDDDYRRADVAIKAGGIHSMAETGEADAPRLKAMAIGDGRIVALAPEPVGADDLPGADDLIGAGTVVVNDPGLTVLPTCDDTHTHLIAAGGGRERCSSGPRTQPGRVPGPDPAPRQHYAGRAVDTHRVERLEGRRARLGGDHAVRAALDAFEAILNDQPGTAPGTLVLEVCGILAPGKLADFAAYPADPFTCSDDELAGLLRFSRSSAAARATTLAGSSPARTAGRGQYLKPGAAPLGCPDVSHVRRWDRERDRGHDCAMTADSSP